MRSDRVRLPGTGFSTNDAAGYYKRVAKRLLPHLKNRAISSRRY